MSNITQFVGRVRAALGWATADRREEAKGKLVELEGSDDGDRSEPTAADERDAIDQAELDVRSDHGDLAPSADRPSRTPQRPPESG